ncbi:MAG: recombinase RecT, partial [Lysobacter sp.]|nr:recombinase RecT [Lysobacter sp.]
IWTHTYAIATLTSREKQFEVLTSAQVEAVRAGRAHTWVSHPEEMRRKTAVRRLFKYIPQAITPQLQFALERDDMLDREAVVETVAPPRRSLAAAVMAGDELDSEDGLPEIPGAQVTYSGTQLDVDELPQ